MSTASISYGSLKDASNEAKSVAKKLGKYADSLYENVYKKLNNYGGGWSSNLTEAKSKTNAKINELRSEGEKYDTYASNLLGLRDECKAVDKAVRSKVSTLTASFKEAYGIKNSKVLNAISYFFTKVGNSTAFGRWLGGIKDSFDAGVNYFKQSIKEWYNYGGGKDLITGVLVGLLEVALGVLAIVGAIFSGGALLVIIAGVIGGVIAAANGIANIWNESKAYSATQNNDPATGKRRSKINTWQDYLRSSYIYGEDGEKYEYNKYYNGLATGIDIVNLACTIVTVVSSCGQLLKNGYKWATGSSAKLSDIKFKDVFSKDTFKAFGSKIKMGFTNGLADIKAAFKFHDWSALKDFGYRILSDAGRNLKAEFWSFDSAKGAVKSIKNMISIPKELLKNGFNFSNIADVGFKGFVLPALTAFTVNSTNGYLTTRSDGQMFFDFTDKITVKDIYRIGDNINSKILGFSLFSNDSLISADVMNKLSSSCNINISIPEINIPNIEMPVFRAA